MHGNTAPSNPSNPINPTTPSTIMLQRRDSMSNLTRNASKFPTAADNLIPIARRDATKIMDAANFSDLTPQVGG